MLHNYVVRYLAPGAKRWTFMKRMDTRANTPVGTKRLYACVLPRWTCDAIAENLRKRGYTVAVWPAIGGGN